MKAFKGAGMAQWRERSPHNVAGGRHRPGVICGLSLLRGQFLRVRVRVRFSSLPGAWTPVPPQKKRQHF